MTLIRRALLCSLLTGCVSPSEEINVTAESGQNVTLTCRTPNKNIVVVEWSRADLESDYVLLYRDEQLVPEHQHPSFKNRVDLQDRQMKDGDVSVILRNVTINDTGTYECRIIQRRTNRWNRALLKTAPISTITLRVVAPPGPGGGDTEDGGKEDGGKEDGGKEDGVSRRRPALTAGLSVFGVICVVVSSFVISKKLKKNFLLPPPDHQSETKNSTFCFCVGLQEAQTEQSFL